MAAPIVATAVKLAANAMTQKAKNAAASQIRGGGTGGNGENKSKAVIAGVIVVILICIFSFVSGVNTVITSHLPTGPEECEVPKVGNNGDSDPANGVPGGTSDGSLGSNIPYPETDSEKVIWPLANGQSLISSGYGYRQVPAGTADFFGTGTYFHNGLDFGAPLGTPIYAVADGIVAQSAPNNEKYGYGTVVTIHHLIGGKKMNTTYGHVLPSSLKFKVGDTVKAGDLIAGVGAEGNSTGAHLHFVVTDGIYTIQSEINKGPANNIDPVPWLASQGATQVSTGLDDAGNPAPVEGGADAKVCGKKSESDGTITAWGGFKNGEIPDAELKALSFAPQFRLAKEAASKLEALNAAYVLKFKSNLPISSAYKSVEDQGGSGTNIAGWAKSIELESSVTFNSEQYSWLSSNAKTYGWMNPLVNQSSGNNPLPTRWVYIGDQDQGVEVPGTLSDYQKYAGEKLQAEGFSSPGELGCLVKLWDRESNWRVDADNPSSDAYGIPQSLPGEKMASEGADWKTNYKTQINWGVKYIKERYGTPCGAWQHSESYNWY